MVGEAPGTSEDAIGLPFVGPAGMLMDQIIEMSLPPSVTYALTNLVACFPREAKDRGDNEPTPDEIAACRPRLVEFVRLCQPKLVILVGQLAGWQIPGANHFATPEEESIGLSWIPPGKVLEFCDIIHPAAILWSTNHRRRMPLAQQQMATQNCIAVIRRAVDNAIRTIRA